VPITASKAPPLFRIARKNEEVFEAHIASGVKDASCWVSVVWNEIDPGILTACVKQSRRFQNLLHKKDHATRVDRRARSSSTLSNKRRHQFTSVKLAGKREAKKNKARGISAELNLRSEVRRTLRISLSVQLSEPRSRGPRVPALCSPNGPQLHSSVTSPRAHWPHQWHCPASGSRQTW
jgi:hypothetical protein